MSYSTRRKLACRASRSSRRNAARGSPSRGWPTDPGLRSARTPPSSSSVPAGATPPASSSPDCTTFSATWLCPTRTSGESASSSVASARLVAEDVLPDRVARRAVVQGDAVGRALGLEAVEKLPCASGARTSRVQRAATAASPPNSSRSIVPAPRDRGCRRGRRRPARRWWRSTRSAAARSRRGRRGTRARQAPPPRSPRGPPPARAGSSGCRRRLRRASTAAYANPARTGTVAATSEVT